jgi:hypothetical protein
MSLVPLGQLEGRAAPSPPRAVDDSVDMTTPPVQQVEELTTSGFFTLGCALMQANPPHAIDQPMLARMRRLGLEPGAAFDPTRLVPEVVDAIERGVDDAKRFIVTKPQRNPTFADGWIVQVEDIGAYGADYLQRAAVGHFGLGANLPGDAVYPFAVTDADGRPLDARHRYVLHFEAGELPPARAFWSLTLYGADQFFYDNPLGRYALGDRDALVANDDGSLDLYLQHDQPDAERLANWLPAPAGPFSLVLRIYWPAPSVLNRLWSPPPVRRAGGESIH